MWEKIQNIANRGGEERIDRLGVISDGCQATPAGLQGQKDRGLQTVLQIDFCCETSAAHLRPLQSKNRARREGLIYHGV